MATERKKPFHIMESYRAALLWRPDVERIIAIMQEALVAWGAGGEVQIVSEDLVFADLDDVRNHLGDRRLNDVELRAEGKGWGGGKLHVAFLGGRIRIYADGPPAKEPTEKVQALIRRRGGRLDEPELKAGVALVLASCLMILGAVVSGASWSAAWGAGAVAAMIAHGLFHWWLRRRGVYLLLARDRPPFWEAKRSEIISGVIVGVLVGAILLPIGFFWGRATDAAAIAPGPDGSVDPDAGVVSGPRAR